MSSVTVPRSIGSGTGLGILLVILVFFAFALFPSQQRNADGPLLDIEFVTNGRVFPEALHILYTSVGVPYYQLWRQLGYAGDAAYPLQLLNAVCGALGAAGLYVFVVRVVRKPWLAFLTAATFAFSYGYWFFAVDAFYNPVSYVFLLWSLPLLHYAATIPDLRRRLYLVAGLAGLMTLAVLASQEHAITAFIFFCGLLIRPRNNVPWKTRLISAVSYGAFLTIFLLSAYAAFAFQIANCNDPVCTVNWMRPYGTLWAMYQDFSLDRIVWAVWSLLGAFVPLWRGVALRQLAAGIITPDKLLPQFALAATVFVLLAALVLLITNLKAVWRKHRYTFILSLIWLVPYIPLVVWHDPFGPESWIIPVMPLLVLAAITFDVVTDSMPAPRMRWVGVAGAVVVSLIFLANLTQAILPDHRDPNPDILAARYAAAQLSDQDIIVSPRWDWTLYLSSEGKSLSMMSLSLEVAGRNPDPERLIQALDQEIAAVEAAGGHAFLVDVFEYDSSYWAWIARNTGLRLEHFTRYQTQPAWEFNGEQIWLIELTE